MMGPSNRCSRCDKTVYPIEELKCLDKVWHKGCFKCQECGMVLNLKTYKVFNKMPYCNAHIPQVKYTAVADTPEARRLAENTRIQSNIKYHQDFEKLKGKVTQVADDPEIKRICNTSKIISNVAYHGELEKKKQMEQKRSLLPDNEGLQQINNQLIKSDAQMFNNSRSMIDKDRGMSNINDYNSNHRFGKNVTSSNSQNDKYPIFKSPYSDQLQSTVIYTSDQGPVHAQMRTVGSIADYDPLNDNYGSLAAGRRNENAYFYQTPKRSGKSYRAIYNYKAQEADEVSFSEGDLIINCESIDDGWMTGIVERTGEKGMLPANYVMLVQE